MRRQSNAATSRRQWCAAQQFAPYGGASSVSISSQSSAHGRVIELCKDAVRTATSRLGPSTGTPPLTTQLAGDRRVRALKNKNHNEKRSRLSQRRSHTLAQTTLQTNSRHTRRDTPRVDKEMLVVSLIPWWLSALPRYHDDYHGVSDVYNAALLPTVAASFLEDIPSHSGGSPVLASRTTVATTSTSVGEEAISSPKDGGGFIDADEGVSPLDALRGVFQRLTAAPLLPTPSFPSVDVALLALESSGSGNSGALTKQDIIPIMSPSAEMFGDVFSEDASFLLGHHPIIMSLSALFLFRFKLLLVNTQEARPTVPEGSDSSIRTLGSTEEAAKITEPRRPRQLASEGSCQAEIRTDVSPPFALLASPSTAIHVPSTNNEPRVEVGDAISSTTPVDEEGGDLSVAERLLLAARTAPFRGSPEVRVLYSDETGFLLRRNMQAAVAATWGLRPRGPASVANGGEVSQSEMRNSSLEEAVSAFGKESPYEATAGNVMRELRGSADVLDDWTGDEAPKSSLPSSKRTRFDTRRAADSILNIYTLHPYDFTALFKRSGARYSEYHNKTASPQAVKGSPPVTGIHHDAAVRRVHDTAYPFASIVKCPTSKSETAFVSPPSFYMPPSPYPNLPSRLTNVAFVPHLSRLLDLDRATGGQVEGWARSFGSTKQGSPVSSANFAWGHVVKKVLGRGHRHPGAHTAMPTKMPNASTLVSMYHESLAFLKGRAQLGQLPWRQLLALTAPSSLVSRAGGSSLGVGSADEERDQESQDSLVGTPSDMDDMPLPPASLPTHAPAASPQVHSLLVDAGNRASFYRPRLYTWVPRSWSDSRIGSLSVAPLFARHQYASLYSASYVSDSSAKNRCVLEFEVQRRYLEQGLDSLIYSVPKHLYNSGEAGPSLRGYGRMEFYLRLAECNLFPLSYQFPKLNLAHNVAATEEAIFTYSRFRVTHLNGAPIAYWANLATSSVRDKVIHQLGKDFDRSDASVTKGLEAEQLSLSLFDSYSRVHSSRSWGIGERKSSQDAETTHIKLQRLLLRLRSHYLPFISSGEMSKLVSVLQAVMEEDETDLLTPPLPDLKTPELSRTQTHFMVITAAFFPLHTLAAVPPSIPENADVASAASLIVRHVFKCMAGEASVSEGDDLPFPKSPSPPHPSAEEIVKFARYFQTSTAEAGLHSGSEDIVRSSLAWKPATGTLIPHTLTIPRAYGRSKFDGEKVKPILSPAFKKSMAANSVRMCLREQFWTASAVPSLVISFPEAYPLSKRLQAFQCLVEIRQLTRDLMIASASNLISASISRMVADVPFEDPNTGFDEIENLLCDDPKKAGAAMSEDAVGAKRRQRGFGCKEWFEYAAGGRGSKRPPANPHYPHYSYVHLRVEGEGHCDEMGANVEESLRRAKREATTKLTVAHAAKQFGGFTPVVAVEEAGKNARGSPPLLPQLSPAAFALASTFISDVDAAPIPEEVSGALRIVTLPAHVPIANPLVGRRAFTWAMPVRVYSNARILLRSPSVMSSSTRVARTPSHLDTHLCRPLFNLRKMEVPPMAYMVQYATAFPAACPVIVVNAKSKPLGRKEAVATETHNKSSNDTPPSTPLLPPSTPLISMWLEATFPTFYMRSPREVQATTIQDVAVVVGGCRSSSCPPHRPPLGWSRAIALNLWDAWGEAEDDSQTSKMVVLSGVVVSAIRRTDGRELMIRSCAERVGGGSSTRRALPPMVATVSLESVTRFHTSHRRISQQLSALRVKKYLQWFAKYSSRLESSISFFDRNLMGMLAPVMITLPDSADRSPFKVMYEVLDTLLPETSRAPPSQGRTPKYFCVSTQGDGHHGKFSHAGLSIGGSNQDHTALKTFLAGFERIPSDSFPTPPNSLFSPNTLEKLPSMHVLSMAVASYIGAAVEEVVAGFVKQLLNWFPRAVVVLVEGSRSTATVQVMCNIKNPSLLALLNSKIRDHQGGSGDGVSQDFIPVDLLRHPKSGKHYALLTPAQMQMLYVLVLHRRWVIEERSRRYSTGSSLLQSVTKSPEERRLLRSFDAEGSRMDMISPNLLHFEATESGPEVVMGVTARVLGHHAVSAWRGITRRSSVVSPLERDAVDATADTPEGGASSSSQQSAASSSEGAFIDALLTRKPPARKLYAEVGFQAASHQAAFDAGSRKLVQDARLEGSLYALPPPGVCQSTSPVSAVGHLDCSPYARVQHAPAAFGLLDPTDLLTFFADPLFVKGDLLKGNFTVENGCLPSLDAVGCVPKSANPYPLRYIYLDPLLVDMRAVNFTHLFKTNQRRQASATSGERRLQPPTIGDLFTSDACAEVASHIPTSLLFNPVHQLTSIARYVTEGIEACRIRRSALQCIGNIAVRLVELTSSPPLGERRGLSKWESIETFATISWLSCLSATKSELASYVALLAKEFLRVAQAAGRKTVPANCQLVTYLLATPSAQEREKVRGRVCLGEYSMRNLEALIASAFKETDLPVGFYVATALAFQFCGNSEWWIGAENLSTADTRAFLQELLYVVPEILRWYESRHDCHFALMPGGGSDKAPRLPVDVPTLGIQEEVISLSLHPVDYGVVDVLSRDQFNPFRNLPNPLSLGTDVRLYEATKAMRSKNPQDHAATASALYCDILEDLTGMQFGELGARVVDIEAAAASQRREPNIPTAVPTKAERPHLEHAPPRSSQPHRIQNTRRSAPAKASQEDTNPDWASF